MTTLTLKAIAAPDGARTESRLITGRKFTIGRDPDCDLCLSDTSRILSKKHCFIERDGACWTLVDTSTNGTFVNHDTAPLRRASQELRNEDFIEVGGYRFEVVIGEDEPLSAPASSSHGLPSTRYDEERPAGSVFSHVDMQGSDGVAHMGEVAPLSFEDVSINVYPKADDTPVMHDPGVFHMPCVPSRVVSEIIGDDWDQEPDAALLEHEAQPLQSVAESVKAYPENPFAIEDDLLDIEPENYGLENHSRENHSQEEILLVAEAIVPPEPEEAPEVPFSPQPHEIRRMPLPRLFPRTLLISQMKRRFLIRHMMISLVPSFMGRAYMALRQRILRLTRFRNWAERSG